MRPPRVRREEPVSALDLRVDFDPSAVTKMRRLVDNLRADGDRYFDTFYRTPHKFNDDTMAWAFDLAGKQI